MNNKKKTVIFLVLIVVILGAFLYVRQAKNTGRYKNSSSQSENILQIAGSERDAHGCFLAAGYSWCDLKQKCLRPIDEACSKDSTPIPAPSGSTPVLPDRAATDDFAKVVKGLFTEKYGDKANEMEIGVTKIVGDFAKGSVSEKGGGGMWFAAKENNGWKLVWDGNGIILCSDIDKYPKFPADLIPECFDDKSGKTKKR